MILLSFNPIESIFMGKAVRTFKKILNDRGDQMSQLDQVIGAIDTFYAPTTPQQLRQQTGKSLESFQNTVKIAVMRHSFIFSLRCSL